jgi:hypothetical protein
MGDHDSYSDMFKVQGRDWSLNVGPVTLNRAEGEPWLLQAHPAIDMLS